MTIESRPHTQPKRTTLFYLMAAGLWLLMMLLHGTVAEAAPVAALAAPKVTVTNTAKGVKLSWDKIPGARGYNIYYKYASGLSRIGTVTGKTTYTDEKVVSGRTYTYAVRAYAGKETSSYQAKRILYLRSVNLKVQNKTAGISLTWDKASGARGYEVHRKVWGGKYSKIASLSQNTFSYTDKKTSGGTIYVYAIRAVNGAAKSDFVPQNLRWLAAPNIQLSRMSDGVKISWNRIGGAKAYDIYRKQGNQKFARIHSVTSGTTLSWKDTGANRTQAYTYAVVARNGAARSAYISKTIQVDQKISWNNSWTYAGNSKIHSSSVKLYRSPNPKGIVVAVNAGHGTAGGESVKTLCHPDGSGKVTGGSTAAGSTYAIAVSSGTTMLDGTPEPAVTLSCALLLKEKLLANGYDVLMIRESSDVQLDNIARTVLANQYADCHIAIHYDSTTSDKGFFFCGVPEIASYRNMVPVSQNWQKHMRLGSSILEGMRRKGRKIYLSGNIPLDLTQTSYSTIPSVDVEVGDRASDHSRGTQSQIADAIVEGVRIYFGK
ncbi:MAG: N-acetylmuramoyl-L-alanine amidase [Eubacteriales bacterium]|nr:N-acetylmuramoyl-L-alanine amidase [Eubacteriales bacterium]